MEMREKGGEICFRILPDYVTGYFRVIRYGLVGALYSVFSHGALALILLAIIMVSQAISN